jgi:dihydrofolate synthase/folylpolyglutamate synthase
MKLIEFLDAKPLYYDEIDYDRMPRTYAAIKEHIKLPKIIHLVGTNGKGTTGRFIANALYRSGLHVGHYTSPHILTFNERIWIDGANIGDGALEAAHETLFALLGQERADALSYFEYTTLLAMIVYRDCDWVVLEAGLGGEHDATNVFAKQLSVFTPIDRDHEAFLGDTIEAIATTKLRSMGPAALTGIQPHEEVYGHYDRMAVERNSRHHRVKEILTGDDISAIHTLAQKQDMPLYLEQNLQLAVAAVKCIGVGFEPQWFEDVPLFGRLSRISDNVVLDVGHNRLAAEAICRAIAPEKIVLVYNSYKDKDYDAIMEALKPVIKRVEIIEVEEDRIAERQKLESVLREKEIVYSSFEGIDENEQYLVFGSFSVAEAFLREYHA